MNNVNDRYKDMEINVNLIYVYAALLFYNS